MDWPALLDATLEWLDTNKDWLFSGIGVVIVAGIGGWLFKRRKAGPAEPPPSPNVTVTQGPSDQLVERYVDELMLTREAVAGLFGAGARAPGPDRSRSRVPQAGEGVQRTQGEPPRHRRR